MKNLLLMFGLVLCLFTANSTKTYAQQGLEIGVKVIPQSVWIFNSDDFDVGDELDFKRKFGMAYGLNLGLNFSDNMGIQSGLLFSSQGQKYKHEGLSYQISEIELKYLKIPFLVKFNSDPYAPTGFFLAAGIQYGFLRSATETRNNIETNYDAINAETKDFYNKKEISYLLTFGPQFNITDNFNLTLAFRADYSTNDIEDKDTGLLSLYPNNSAKRVDSKNLTTGIQVGINYVIAR